MLENKELSDIVTALGLRDRARRSISSKLRYGKIILLMDADSDGHHIATLLLTFFYRHLPQLIERRHVYLAQPPLYRIDIGKETLLGARRGAQGRDPEEAAMHGQRQARHHALQGPRRDDAEGAVGNDARPRDAPTAARRASTDPLVTDRVINELMGKDASARFRFIMEHAGDAQALDV